VWTGRLIGWVLGTALTIGGIVVAIKTSDLSYNSEFHKVWVSTLVLTCLTAATVIIDTCTLCGATDSNSNKKVNNNLNILMSTAQVGVTVWLCDLYYNRIDVNALYSQYYSLYVLMLTRIIIFYIGCALGIIIILAACCFVCYSKSGSESESGSGSGLGLGLGARSIYGVNNA